MQRGIEMAQTATANATERDAVVNWFRTDFEAAVRSSTSLKKLEDGRIAYTFSATNDSGFSFEHFSFLVRVINKADGNEIGSAKIRAGAWAKGEKKTFRSKLSLPEGAKSLSFVMPTSELEVVVAPLDPVSSAMDDMGSLFREMGDAITGADGSGGVFGELFGNGGMPETGTSAPDTSAAKPSGTASAKTASSKKSSNSGTVDARPKTANTAQRSTQSRPSNSVRRTNAPQTFSQRKNEKKLNKKRLGKSGWTIAGLALGVLFLMSAAGSGDDPTFRLQCAAVGAAFLAASGITKLITSRKGKLIRTYESKINMNGNTSIDELAAAVGKSFEKTADDLQQMIVDGFFGEAYIEINNRLLVMTRNGQPIESVEKSAAMNNKARRKAGKAKAPESLDDLIAITDDAEIKSKLKTLRTITKKIDERVEAVPELEKQVKDFREKYYPEVVRLTDEYNDKIADMGKLPGASSKEEVSVDSSGAPVLNTNPSYLDDQAKEIKSQLISLIDSVTEASENLLEKLLEDDIMDITTDIKMLQTTLASKGLLDSDFDIK